jgi:hypothetical protein
LKHRISATIPATGALCDRCGRYLRSFGSADGVGLVALPQHARSTAPYQLVYLIHQLGHSLGMYHVTLCPQAHVPCQSIPAGAPSPVGNASIGYVNEQNTGISHINGRMQFPAYPVDQICETVMLSKCTWLANEMASVAPSKDCPNECSAEGGCTDGDASEDHGRNLTDGKCLSFCGYRFGNRNSGSSDADPPALRRCGEGASYQIGDFVDCTMCGPVDPNVRLCENKCSPLCNREHCFPGNETFGGLPLVNGWCTMMCSEVADPQIAPTARLVDPQTCGHTDAYRHGRFQVCEGCSNIVDTLGSTTLTVSGGHCKLPFSYHGRDYRSCARVPTTATPSFSPTTPTPSFLQTASGGGGSSSSSSSKVRV